jgi:hypothetical protein
MSSRALCEAPPLTHTRDEARPRSADGEIRPTAVVILASGDPVRRAQRSVELLPSAQSDTIASVVMMHPRGDPFTGTPALGTQYFWSLFPARPP